MPGSVRLRQDFSSLELRRLASRSKDANQSRRLLSLAAVLDGMSRADAARIGGMDRQTLRDWVHWFNHEGPDGLFETGPDPEVDGVVRWRRVDLQRLIKERFGVAYHERHVGTLLKKLGFSHMSARPRHPGQDAATVTAFKKTSRGR